MKRTGLAYSTLALALAMFLTGAANGPSADDSSSESDEATVRVVNRNWLDMRVYAVVHGTARRLGTVTSLSTEEFRIPRSIVAGPTEIKFVAVPIGRREASIAQSISVEPRDRLEYRIENAIRISSLYRK